MQALRVKHQQRLEILVAFSISGLSSFLQPTFATKMQGQMLSSGNNLHTSRQILGGQCLRPVIRAQRPQASFRRLHGLNVRAEKVRQDVKRFPLEKKPRFLPQSNQYLGSVCRPSASTWEPPTQQLQLWRVANPPSSQTQRAAGRPLQSWLSLRMVTGLLVRCTL